MRTDESMLVITNDPQTGVERYSAPGGTGDRSKVIEQSYKGEHCESSVAWYRVIEGSLYSFRRVAMKNGEVRFVVYKYNGYQGGPKFACAWSHVHWITVYPELPEPPDDYEYHYSTER